ncbi:hypothetical protein T459_19769 [Capsicum annuum]|uniref:Uncharacterized protein n=1 Tax=Capsicum annuum TaxID=4072 RepID=A0A2G2Z2K7_CAPAN|nr:hypothetical protein T459_19769 [Capsicum annuum]
MEDSLSLLSLRTPMPRPVTTIAIKNSSTPLMRRINPNLTKNVPVMMDSDPVPSLGNSNAHDADKAEPNRDNQEKSTENASMKGKRPMMGSNLQSRIVGKEDDLEQIKVATQDFEPYGPDVGNKKDPPLRPMVYPESESSVEKLMTRGVPTGTRKISFTGDHTGVLVPTNLPYSPINTTWKAHTEQTVVAVVDDDKRLIGKISSSTLVYYDEDVAAAIMTFSSCDLMVYIDCGGPPEDLIGLVKMRLQEKKLSLMMELMDEKFPVSSSSSSASSGSSDDESRLRKNVLGRSSTRRSEAITCYPRCSLVVVLIQPLAHRASSIWVIDKDHNLVGVITFKES